MRAAGRALVEAGALRQPAAGLRPRPEDVLAHLGRKAAHFELLEDGDRGLQVATPLMLGGLLEGRAGGGIPRRLGALVEPGAQRPDLLLLARELGFEAAEALLSLGQRALAQGQLARLEQIGQPSGALRLELAPARLGSLLMTLLDQRLNVRVLGLEVGGLGGPLVMMALQIVSSLRMQATNATSWVWLDNPAGMFSMWNPGATCAPA